MANCLNNKQNSDLTTKPLFFYHSSIFSKLQSVSCKSFLQPTILPLFIDIIVFPLIAFCRFAIMLAYLQNLTAYHITVLCGAYFACSRGCRGKSLYIFPVKRKLCYSTTTKSWLFQWCQRRFRIVSPLIIIPKSLVTTTGILQMTYPIIVFIRKYFINTIIMLHKFPIPSILINALAQTLLRKIPVSCADGRLFYRI